MGSVGTGKHLSSIHRTKLDTCRFGEYPKMIEVNSIEGTRQIDPVTLGEGVLVRLYS